MGGEQRVEDLIRLGAGREAEVFAWDAGRALRLARTFRGYRSVRAVDFELVRRWEWVCAAARLAEDIDAERDALLATATSGAKNQLRGWDSNPQPLG
jgi:hypothetical protein